MKKFLPAILVLGLLFTACKKSDSDSSSIGSWKVGSNSYTATTVAASNFGVYILSASNSSGSIAFVFSGTPAAGSYKVVSNNSSPGNTQCRFTTGTYGSTGTDNVSATVSVNSGKVSISMPDANAVNTGSSTDIVKVSASGLTQQ